jgi:pyruvate kinase
MSRLTKIVCTLGPSCSTEKQIAALIEAGMNVARVNLSHGSWQQHAATIGLIQKINRANEQRQNALPVTIMIDTKGAEVRTTVVEKPLEIAEGETVIFSHRTLKNEKKKVVLVNHSQLARDAKNIAQLVIDNGKMFMKIVKIRRDGAVVTIAQESGSIGSRRHVNLPGAYLHMPTMMENDWQDLERAAKLGVDAVALSFVRCPKDVELVRGRLRKLKSSMLIIAKIETVQAVESMEGIIAVSDGIMVARGDLGSEVPFERIPAIQDRLVQLCKEAGKPVIVATHMLESMIENPTPTRAEVTDIAHAATTGADATMLSGETASGAHPLLAIDAMNRVLVETEKHVKELRMSFPSSIRSPRDAQAESAVELAILSKASAILVMTRTGQTVRDVARFRPLLPVIAATANASVQRQVQICFGVRGIHVPFSSDPEKTIAKAVQLAMKRKILRRGQSYVVVSDARAHGKNVSSIQVRTVE